MIKLKRVFIRHFRNVKPESELVLADGFNVVLGKNGTGKTTLLRLLEAIACSDFSPFKNEDFGVDYEWDAPDFHARIHVENQRSEVPLSEPVHVGARGTVEFASRLHMEFTYSGRERPVYGVISTVNGVTTRTLDGVISDIPWPAIPTEPYFMLRAIAPIFSGKGKEGDFRVLLARLTTKRFDESLGFYESEKLKEFNLSSLGSTVSLVHWGGMVFADTATAQAPPPTLTVPPSNQPFVETFRAALALKSAEFRLSLVAREADGETRYGKLQFWLTRRDGSQFGDELLSYGQKRLLSFLLYLASSEDLVIADELVNGLHHDWIELCLREIGSRQAFLTSQNPLLMDYLSFDSVEEVQRSFILCELGYEGDKEQLRWRNMTEAEAKTVFEASEIGIEHLSTILRNEGLW